MLSFSVITVHRRSLREGNAFDFVCLSGEEEVPL